MTGSLWHGLPAPCMEVFKGSISKSRNSNFRIALHGLEARATRGGNCMAFFSKTFDKLKGALKKTRDVMFTDVRTLFVPGRQINDEFLDELEEKFLQADMGVNNVGRIIKEIRDRWRLGKIKNASDAESVIREFFPDAECAAS